MELREHFCLQKAKGRARAPLKPQNAPVGQLGSKKVAPVPVPKSSKGGKRLLKPVGKKSGSENKPPVFQEPVIRPEAFNFAESTKGGKKVDIGSFDFININVLGR